MPARRKIPYCIDEAVLGEKCTMFNLLYRLIPTHRVLSLRQFIIWPFGKLFFGRLANFCDETERFVELSQS
jgi:hypothetical protein